MNYFLCLGCKTAFSQETYAKNGDRCPRCGDAKEYGSWPWGKVRGHVAGNGIRLPAVPKEGESYDV